MEPVPEALPGQRNGDSPRGTVPIFLVGATLRQAQGAPISGLCVPKRIRAREQFGPKAN
jgi:hypothetical protein